MRGSLSVASSSATSTKTPSEPSSLSNSKSDLYASYLVNRDSDWLEYRESNPSLREMTGLICAVEPCETGYRVALNTGAEFELVRPHREPQVGDMVIECELCD